jgi:mannose-1-phosphate guanylyltransferase
MSFAQSGECVMDNFYAVIMAGGRGERFWPLSTSERPKQVLSLVGGKPLMQLAVDRLDGIIPPERILVITNADLVDAMCDATPDLPRENVVGEPFGRDTAAAVALASSIVKARNPNGVFCVLTADHVIYDLDIFKKTLIEGCRVAEDSDLLLTIGIVPDGPSTAFGYIEQGESYDQSHEIEFVRVQRFVEKPDAETAEKYVKSGSFSWNSGMFIWSVQSIQSALKKYQPQLLAMADAVEPLVDKQGFDAKLEEEYNKLERVSIDYAIMEKADNIIMAKGVFRWYDVGSWPALKDHFDADKDGNVLIGKAEQIDSEENIVYSDGRLTALIGVSDLVVVQAEGATLIWSKDKAQDVKKMVKLLADKGSYKEVL